MPFAKYAADWLDQRQLSPKTAQLYELLLRLHLAPTFGETSIGDIRQEHVRAWRAAELKTGQKQHPPFGPVTVAKAYRLLRAILSTAVTDKRIRENPCQIKGADKESSPERPVLSVPEVYRLADAIAPRYRALVLLATFGNMRWGELAGLRRRDLDLDGRRVRVVETVYEFGQLVKGTPKSEASKRKITLPELIMPELRAAPGYLFGAWPRRLCVRGGQGRPAAAQQLLQAMGSGAGQSRLPDDLHVHDLRHTGNTLAAEAGASLGELMNRMGHSVHPRSAGSTCTRVRNGNNSSPRRSTRWPGGSSRRLARSVLRADRARSGHATRNPASRGVRPGSMYKASELRIRGHGAGDGNRTRTISLGS